MASLTRCDSWNNAWARVYELVLRRATPAHPNLPRQQRGLHTKGFEYMRLSNQMEGLIGNYHQLIDGYLSGKSSAALVPAAQQVSGCIDRPVVDLGV